MKTLLKFIHLILGEYYKHKFSLWLRQVRLNRAKDLAMRLHRQHNGRRFFVLEVDYKPGFYTVMNWQEIKAAQRGGSFSDRAKQFDFLREAAYYTPAGTRLSVEKMDSKRQEKNSWILFALLILILSLLIVIAILNDMGHLNT